MKQTKAPLFKEIEEIVKKYKEYLDKSKHIDIVKTKFGYVYLRFDFAGNREEKEYPLGLYTNPARVIQSGKELERIILKDIETDECLFKNEKDIEDMIIAKFEVY